MNKLAYADLSALDLFDLAAVYAFGIAGREAVEQVLKLATGELDEVAFAAWLRSYAT